MKNKLIGLLLLGSLAQLTGCATPARVDHMTVSGTPSQRISTTPLRNNVAIHDVTGGQETNPMWKSNVGSNEFSQALEGSLRAVGLLAPNRQTGSHALTVHLQNIDQPLFGIDMTVTATVNYIVTEKSTNKEVFSRSIAVPYTATFGDSPLGVERLKLANEGAIRSNISKLIDELLQLKVDTVSVALPLQQPTPQSKEAQLKELQRLKESGLITMEVYLAQQKEILATP